MSEGATTLTIKDKPHAFRGCTYQTRRWMLTQLARRVTLADMAAHAGMAERTFSRHFVAENGTTPKQFLQAARIEQAQSLLTQTDINLNEVARLTGLGTRANFRRIFVQSVGVLPAEYRRSRRGMKRNRRPFARSAGHAAR
jgi:transcriptional regulator GlxA family with amidase domain